MKLSLLSILIAVTTFLQQESIYDLEVQPVEGGSPINLSVFAGKKIIITTFNANTPDTTQLAFLDSLQQSNTQLQVIATPATDLGGVNNNQSIDALKAGLALSFIVTQTAMVTKRSASDQLALFRWLTDVSKNGHFDIDVNAPGQYFIVSGSGILYSVLPGEVPSHILTSALNQEVTQ